MFKNINIKVLIKSVFIIGLCAFVCYFGAFVRAEGDNGILSYSLWFMFYVLTFPVLHILDFFQLVNNFSILILGLIANSFLYGFLTERIITKFKEFRKLDS